MDYARFGSTGLKVSRLCLGCMTYGVPERGNHPWTLGEEASRPLIRQALEAGINFFDTANVYSDGTSRKSSSRALKDFSSRDDVVIATKVHGRMRPGPNGAGLSRRAILAEIDNQPAPAGHRLRGPVPDPPLGPHTPIEETLEALHDVVKAGRGTIRVGASSMYAWQFSKAIYTSRLHGWTVQFVGMQDHVNLLNREEEREMLPLCSRRGHRGDAVEPAGARPPDAAVAGRQRSARRATRSAGRSIAIPRTQTAR
ncbi:aldo/keto reductase [Cupriavidus basilensis]